MTNESVVTKPSESNPSHLARRLGLFDVVMIVMGGIIGSGIFINPYVVAQQVPSAPFILGAWIIGGLIALLGAFIYAELSSQTSLSGGQYIYLRDAFHPALAFAYGWSLLLVIQSGGMAAVAVTFAKYFFEITGHGSSDTSAAFLAAIVVAALVLINCLGVRAGSTTQNVFMILKLMAIAVLIAFGLTVHAKIDSLSAGVSQMPLRLGVGPALIPVFFAYGGWQTACFVAGEVRDSRRTLPRGLVIGVIGVVLVYVAVNFVCVRALGAQGLAATKTPASAVMRLALGSTGGQIIAAGIAISTIGFLSQSMLTAPRVYFAMAEDKVFFSALARLNSAQVPAFAIALQGLAAIVIALSGRYEQILNYVVSVDVLFFALTATCVFVYRNRAVDPVLSAASPARTFRIPGHPLTTILFILACAAIVLSTIFRYPNDSLIGLGLMVSGVPIYFLWRKSYSLTH